MDRVVPGNEFNILHGLYGSGDGVWSGPYTCNKVMDDRVYYTTESGITESIHWERCFRLDNTKYEVLSKLSNERILNITKSHGMFTLTEMCDHHFEVTLTREEMLKLAEEIIQTANEGTKHEISN